MMCRGAFSHSVDEATEAIKRELDKIIQLDGFMLSCPLDGNVVPLNVRSVPGEGYLPVDI